MEKIANDTIDMAEHIKSERGGDRKELSHTIMSGLKTIANDAVSMATEISKL